MESAEGTTLGKRRRESEEEQQSEKQETEEVAVNAAAEQLPVCDEPKSASVQEVDGMPKDEVAEEGKRRRESEEEQQSEKQETEEVAVNSAAEQVPVCDEPESASVQEVDGMPKDEVAEEGKDSGDAAPSPVKLGPKVFNTSVEMFTYFYDLLHGWISNVDINKYEHLVLSDLITNGHRDAEAKIGPGIKSFQVRFHPGWHSRCYYIVRTDGTIDDFSYRKCVDKIMPLPESLFSPSGDLIVEKLFGSSGDKFAKKSKSKGNFGGGGGGGFNRGKNNRGGFRARYECLFDKLFSLVKGKIIVDTF